MEGTAVMPPDFDPEWPPEEWLRDLYARIRTIAVVGASSDPAKPSNEIPEYLRAMGYRMLAVTPKGGELFGGPAFTSLDAVDVPVDVVEVFRPPPEGPDIARAAATIGARVVWFQPGAESEEATRAAFEAGITPVAGICMRGTHQRLGLGAVE